MSNFKAKILIPLKRFMLYYSHLVLVILYFFAGACSKNIPIHTNKPQNSPKREFRAAWIATVDNIDWPSKKGLPTATQQEELRSIMNFHQKVGLNAVVVQVRAAADAFYARGSEPWSEWLTGTQGQSPEPYYDPMHFMIDEAHKRNMEFHAWLNLSRGTHKVSKSISTNHITKTKPEWFFTYDGHQLFNLGIPEVRAYIVDIVRNMVKFYDVDGIHFDDYFYPYTVAGQSINDQNTYRQYGKGFGSIEEWRRNNVDELIKAIGQTIKDEKPRVKFGISPFSVWRNASADPQGSKTQAGQPSYDNLYADTRKWFKEGWIDYIAPQIYFTFEFDKVPYKTMVDWWIAQNSDRHIYIGQGTYRVDAASKDRSWADPTQMARQVRYNRQTRKVAGSIFYNTTSLQSNKLGVTDSLRNLYRLPALMPTMPWKDNVPPNAPEKVEVKRIKNMGVVVTWKTPKVASRDSEPIYKWVVYRFDENEIINLENAASMVAILNNDGNTSYLDTSAQKKQHYVYVVTALDRLQNESPASDQVRVK